MKSFKGEVRGEYEFHICVRVCGVEGRGKSLFGQFSFKDDREESSTKSLGGRTSSQDEMGSQIVSSESDIIIIIIFFSSNSRNQNGKMLILRMSLRELLPE